MKKLVSFCILLMLVSCESINYDGKVRLVIKGQVIDKNNNPISDAPIDVIAYREDGNANDLISYGKSDTSGNFLFLIPAPNGSDDLIKVVINEGDLLYQQKVYASIKRQNFDSYQLQLPTILYSNSELSRLEILTQQISSSNKNISEIRLTAGLHADEIVEFNAPIIDYIPYYFSFLVLKNQTVTITYKLTDYGGASPITTEHSESIAIGNTSNVSHTINY